MRTADGDVREDRKKQFDTFYYFTWRVNKALKEDVKQLPSLSNVVFTGTDEAFALIGPTNYEERWRMKLQNPKATQKEMKADPTFGV